MDNAVEKLASDSGILLHVAGKREGAGYTLLDFVFEHGSLRLVCDPDTDEIIVAVRPEDSDGELDDLDDDIALASLRGKEIELAWSMTNHRGYDDAFQIRCLNLETRQEGCCQFEVAAATITVARVS